MAVPIKRPIPASATCCPGKNKPHARPTRGYVELFKSLADETRLEIVGLLAGSGEPLCVCDIESHFELSQPTISHHLRVLRDASIVRTERRGTWIYYSLAPTVREKLLAFDRLLEG